MHSNDSGRPLRQFLTYYRPHRRLFALDMLFALLSCAADLAFPYVSRQAMLRLLPLGLYRTFFAVMAALLAAYLLKAVFKYAVTVIGHRCGVLIEADMRQALFEHLQTMSFRFFDQNRTGVLMSRMTSDLFSITELAHHGPEYLLTAVVTLGGALALMAPICWQLTLVLLLLVPLSVWITMRQRRRMNDANVAVKRRQAEINTVIESGISGVRTAKAFTNEAAEREKFLACNDRYKHSKTDWYRAMGVFQGGMEFTMSAMQVVVIALGGAFIMRGQMDYVDLITFSLYVTTFISPIRTLVNFMEVFTDGTAGFQRFLELMRIQPDIADAPDARELPPVRGQVDYNDVSFDYAGGVNVLSHIDLHIAPGETLAVVGPSGGGKTTLCQLLPRFYDVTQGSVCIDGIDVRTVTQVSLRRDVKNRAEAMNTVLDWPDRVLVISQGDDATRWYYYKYELTAKVVNGYGGTWWGNDDYSSRWDSDFMNLVESLNWTLYDFEAVCTADSLTAYMEEKQIDYLLIDRADDYLEREFSSRFEGGLKANMPATLYRFEGRSKPIAFTPVAVAESGVVQ